jgi:hypothetical protein
MQEPHGSRGSDAAPQASGQGRGSLWINAALVLASAVASLLLIEVGFRLATGVPLLKLANWRTDHVITVAMSELKATVDPVLGWTNRSWSHHEDGYNTIDYGVRRNFDEKAIRTGAVLAVGDSFTEGWDVQDDESWPAVLEKLTEVPVVNAGVGGFGADQTILRAEQLLPIVKPKILIVGFHEIAITRAGYSVYGAPKPYFDLESGAPRYHPPAPIEPPGRMSPLSSMLFAVRDGLGYSAAADYVFARLNRDFWYNSAEQWSYRKADNAEADVTCALLRRLKARTERDGIHMMLFTQYYATVVIGKERATYNVRRVQACAEEAGIRVVDQLPSLREIESARRNSMPDYYYMYDGELYGHMTPKGNEHAATLLSAALRDWLPSIAGASRATGAVRKPSEPGGGATE